MQQSAPESRSLEVLQDLVNKFSDDREWGKFHTPKNLSMALSVEASELMEIFQWQDGSEGMSGLPKVKQLAVADEVADVFVYLLRFCSVTGIDLLGATHRKLELNAQKYPVDLAKGSSKKYDEL